MSETTQIHPDKVRAYLATDYRLGHTDQDIVLTIGKHSERLATLFAGKGVNFGAFLTAYNPQGTIQSDAANAQGHAELASKLQELGLKAIEGSGSEEGTEWPAEKSYFALGLALEPAKAIGAPMTRTSLHWCATISSTRRCAWKRVPSVIVYLASLGAHRPFGTGSQCQSLALEPPIPADFASGRSVNYREIGRGSKENSAKGSTNCP